MRKLRSNLISAAIANVALALSQFLLVWLIASEGSLETVGQFALVQSVLAPIFMFSQMELRPIVATSAAIREHYHHALRFRFVTSSAAALCVISATFFVTIDSQLRGLFWSVTAMKFFESISDVIYGAFQNRDHFRWVSRAVLLKCLIGIPLLAVTLIATQQIVLATAILAFSRALLLFVHDLPLLFRQLMIPHPLAAEPATSAPLVRWPHLLPLGFTALILSLNSTLPRYALSFWHGNEVVGQFSIITTVFLGLTTLSSAISQTFAPRLGKAYINRDINMLRSNLIRIGQLQIYLVITACAVAFAMGKTFLHFAFGPSSTALHHYLIFLLLASITPIGAGVTYTTLLAIKHYRWITPLYLVTLTFTILVNLLWVPEHGIGAAIAGIAISGLPMILIGQIMIWQKIRTHEGGFKSLTLTAGETPCVA